MLHVLILGEQLNDEYATILAFCAAYIHDLERLHDGYCANHAEWATMFALPKYKEFFLSIGLEEKDLDIIAYATKIHSLPD